MGYGSWVRFLFFAAGRHGWEGRWWRSALAIL